MSGGPVHLRPQRLVYVRMTGPYETSVPKAWSKLLGWVERAGMASLVASWYGLARDNPYQVAHDQCRYDACVPVDPMFEDRALRELGLTTLPGGPHERHKHIGGYADVIARLGAFYSTHAPQNGLQFDLRRPIVTVYFSDPRQTDEAKPRADLCVPLQSVKAAA